MDITGQLPLFQPPAKRLRELGGFSRYVVYVDESGDHGIANLDENYPVFALAFSVFDKLHYLEDVVPKVQQLKFETFGHDIVVLHEAEIVKEKGAFSGVFRSKAEKTNFLTKLTTIIESVNFILISCVVDKRRITKAAVEEGVYNFALGHCLETLFEFLQEKGQHKLRTSIVFEARGKVEDRDLELAFRRICDGNNVMKEKLPFGIVIADKKTNSTGLQFSDLMARPIGLSVLKPDQPNQAFEVLKPKFYCSGGRCNVGHDYLGFGLKVKP